MAAAASGSGVVVNPNTTLIGDAETNPTSAVATLQYNSDGSVAVVGNMSASGASWFLPNSSGVGAGYWARLTINTGSGPTSGSGTGSWLSLAAAKSWTWTVSPGGTLTATATLELASDSGGSNILFADAFSVDVSSEL